MAYLTATEYTHEEYVGDNLVSIIDRKEASGNLYTFFHLTDREGDSVLLDFNEMFAIMAKVVEMLIEMENQSPLRKKE